MKETIMYEWKKNGAVKKKEIERDELLARMCSLVMLYPEDNVIAKQIVEVLPITVTLKVDKDRYEDEETPKIYCVDAEGVTRSIAVKKRHTIIWAMLDKYFS